MMVVGVKLGVVAAGHKYSASTGACPHIGLLIMPVARHRLHAKRHGTEEDRAVHFVEGGGRHLHMGNVRLRQEMHPDVLCVQGLAILKVTSDTNGRVTATDPANTAEVFASFFKNIIFEKYFT